MKKMILILGLGAFLSGCATHNTADPVRLDCPPPLVLPKLTEQQDLAFYEWNREIYAVMVKREDLYVARIETMCRIIESTHAGA